MYPYKEYNAEFGEVVYNHDGSEENELAINIDKELHNITHFHTYTRLYNLYNDDAFECEDIVHAIINNWMYENKYSHIELIAKYYNEILRNERFIASHF